MEKSKLSKAHLLFSKSLKRRKIYATKRSQRREHKELTYKIDENYQAEMLEGAKLIGAGAATIASAGAAIGIGNVLSSSIHSVARNPSLAKQSFGYAILGFALTEAIASFAPMMAFLISSVFRSKVWERSWSGKGKKAPRIWVARGHLCPDGGALWGTTQPNRDSTPPTSSAPLYRLNHSKGLIGGTDKAAIKAMLVNRVGAMTSFLAATTGILQNDLKRVIAYSTCSQLGYMSFACGISNYSPISKYCDDAAVAHPTRLYEVTIHPTRSSGVNKNWGSDAGEIPANG
ncbi:hypothetical protein L6452_36265 [Arctium lappa]|uniref:Uncharacterized protein n=1 Tax=Arctium lappa TaxID=4217 RepID=A0ACB8Y8W2_ARCLA|nr:hypothetical protein L6452_36265 [Arctium lappa]